MVADALQDVAHHLRVEEPQGQFHQLDEEVRNQRNVDACVHVQQYPASDKLHRQLRHRHHQLCHQYQGDERQVAVTDAHIHQSLSQEREHQLQQRAHHHSQYQLHQFPAVGRQVAEEEPQSVPSPRACRLVLALVELRCRFQSQCRTPFFPVLFGRQPRLLHLGICVRHPLQSRVGYVVPVSVPLLADVVAHHEVPLLPVQDAGQRHIPP